MILFELDINDILSKLVGNRTAGKIMRSYQKLIGQLKEKCIQPILHLLDNKCSEKLKEVIKKNSIKYQLVPPHDHRHNIAEKVIQFSRTTSYRYCVGQINIFPCNYGARYFPTQSTN